MESGELPSDWSSSEVLEESLHRRKEIEPFEDFAAAVVEAD